MTPRLVTVVLTALVLAACGGDAETSADEPAASPAPTTVPDAPADPASAPSAGPVGDGPDATVPAGVPPEFLPAIGPVEVRGAALPALETDDVAADPAVGTPAPVLVGLDYDGATVRVDGAADGPTMVVFLAHWCPHCNAEIPRLNELRDGGRFPDSLSIVGVSTAANPGRPNFPPADWLTELDWTYPAMADGIDLERETFIAADAFGVSGFPFVALIDGDGNVAARWSGEREPDEIIALIAQHLGTI